MARPLLTRAIETVRAAGALGPFAVEGELNGIANNGLFKRLTQFVEGIALTNELKEFIEVFGPGGLDRGTGRGGAQRPE